MITLDRQIACVKREIAMRERVYATRVERGKMKQSQADEEIAAMKAVLAVLATLESIGFVTPDDVRATMISPTCACGHARNCHALIGAEICQVDGCRCNDFEPPL